MGFRISAGIKWIAAAAAPALVFGCVIALCGTRAARADPAPLSDPAFLNIGLACSWNDHCMTVQRKAMARSLSYVRKTRPQSWRVQLCNRNARRGYSRVDWIGFDHCIRNEQLSRAVANDARRRARR